MIEVATAERTPGTGLEGNRSRVVARWRSVTDWAERHPLLTIFLLAMVVRGAVSTAIFLRSGGTLFADDATYSDMARAVVRGQTESWDAFTQHLYDSAAAFTLPLTLVFWVLSPIQLLGQLVAALGGALAAVFVTKLCMFVLRPRQALVAGLWMALLPSQVVFSSLTLKDSFVWAVASGTAVAVAVYCGRMGRRRVVVAGLAVVVGLILLAHLRPHSMVIACWALALTTGLLAARRVLTLRRTAFAVAVAVLLPFVLGAGVAGSDLLRFAGRLERMRLGNAYDAATAFVPVVRNPPEVEIQRAQADADEASAAAAVATAQREEAEATVAILTGSLAALEADVAAAEAEAARREAVAAYEQAKAELEAERQRLAQVAAAEQEAARAAADRLAEARAIVAQAAVPMYPEQENIAANVTHLPKGLAVMFIEPYPWQFSGNRSVQLAAAELIVWYPLLALALLGLPSVLRRLRLLLFPFFVGGATALMYALAEGNFGTAYRHRGEFTWLLAVLAAFGVVRLREILAAQKA